MTKPARVFLLGLLLLPACGDDVSGASDTTETRDASPADADALDAADADTVAPPGDVVRLDWSSVRGAPFTTVGTSVSERALMAVHADGLVTVAACEVDVGCDYAWLNAAGEEIRTSDDRIAVYGRTLPPAADLMHVVAPDEAGLCGDTPPFPTVVAGTVEVVALATGVPRFTAPLRTNVFIDSAFSSLGRWFRVAPLADDACAASGETWRDVVPPHTTARLPAAFFIAGERPDGLLFGWRDDEFGVVDPRADNSFAGLGDRVDAFLVGGGWLHALDGFGDLTEAVHAVAADGSRYDLTLPTGVDHRGRAAWGRSLLACTQAGSERGVHECTVFDVADERPSLALDLLAGTTPTFIGGGDAVVYATSTDGVDRSLSRLDLTTGTRAVIAANAGALRPLGNGAAALWHDEAGLTLIDRDRVELLVAGPIAQVLTAPTSDGVEGLRQHDIAVIVVTTAVEEHRLLMLDLATHRLVTLTERLYFAPTVGNPLAADTCGQPWVLRSAGGPTDGLVQESRWLFFVERPDGAQDAALFVVPLDLEAPPRRLTAMHPIYCHPPLASPDGSLLAIDVDHFDGQSSHLTIARTRE